MQSNRNAYLPIPPETERIGKIVLDAAYKVHTALGPGLIESVYEACAVLPMKYKNRVYSLKRKSSYL